MEYVVRHGLKLFERKCVACKLVTFWVPRSSPQKVCSLDCMKDAGLWKWSPTAMRKKRKKIYELKEDDYEEID